MTFTLAVNAEVDLASENKYRKGVPRLNCYRKVVSYMTYNLLVDKLNFLLISSFFDAN